MKYKVDDIVRIKSKKWFEKYAEYDHFKFRLLSGCLFNRSMTEHCGHIAKIKSINNDRYKLDIDKHGWSWTDEMLEDCQSQLKHTIQRRKFSKIGNLIY